MGEHRNAGLEEGALSPQVRALTSGDGYLVDHGSITYFMGPDGGFVTLFPHGTDPAFMADAIRRYLD